MQKIQARGAALAVVAAALGLMAGAAVRAQEAAAPAGGGSAAPAVPAAPVKPAAPAAGPIKDLPATGVIVEACSPPDVKADYPHYLRKFYVKQLTDESGKPVGTGDAVVWVLAMHNRKVLPVASAAVGEKLAVRLTAWSLVQNTYGKIQTGSLPTVTLEIEKPFFWGEVAGQPQLTAEELSRVGESDAPEERAVAPGSAEAAK